jgi:hypothetical protein
VACDAAKQFDALAQRGALVLEGVALTALVAP